MKWTKKLNAVGGASALLALSVVTPASAYTIQTHAPETPENTASLPIVSTYQKSENLKPNILNPHPVCNAWEDYRTVVYQTNENFLPIGTISTKNQTDKDIPLTQELSKTQNISLSVNGQATSNTNINADGSANLGIADINAKLAHETALKVDAHASYSISWTAGQTIGPYNVPAGYTGEATYGFKTVKMSGTQQHCTVDGTWSNPVPWNAHVPVKNEVQVKLYKKNADSYITSYDENGEVIEND